MQVGDLVKNNYNEIGVIVEEWGEWNRAHTEKQWYVLYSSGNTVVTSEYDLEVIC